MKSWREVLFDFGVLLILLATGTRIDKTAINISDGETRNNVARINVSVTIKAFAVERADDLKGTPIGKYMRPYMKLIEKYKGTANKMEGE